MQSCSISFPVRIEKDVHIKALFRQKIWKGCEKVQVGEFYGGVKQYRQT